MRGGLPSLNSNHGRLDLDAIPALVLGPGKQRKGAKPMRPGDELDPELEASLFADTPPRHCI